MIADSVMPSAPFRRDRSWFEVLAVLLSMCTLCALMLALVETSWLFFTDPFPEAWGAFTWCWQRAFVAVAALLATLALFRRRLPQRQSLRWAVLTLAIVAAGALGWAAEDSLTLVVSGEHISAGERPYMLHTMFVLAMLVAVLGEYRYAASCAPPNRCTAPASSRLRQQSELAEGRLQLLQAQIEPHFLFNSLANVRRLLRTDGNAGRAMLTDLLRYLESALPRLREDAPDARARNGGRAGLPRRPPGADWDPRLQVEFDMPAELGQRVVPPMMLLTLVENALKHGLQPLLEGGSLDRVGASSGPTTSLRVQVADTGRGLGTGPGLRAPASRTPAPACRSMYGPAAELVAARQRAARRRGGN